MLNDRTRTKSGTMSEDLQAKVDVLLDEFVAAINFLTDERHLQKGIARSQLPSSMIAILDKENLYILGQFRTEARFSSYLHTPEFVWPKQKISSSAQWEFGFEDPYIVKFPATLLDQELQQRQKTLYEIAAQHIDSEFNRFVGLLNLLRSRPIFGPAPPAIESRTAFLLLPSDESLNKNHEAIIRALEFNEMTARTSDDITNGKAAVREMWVAINQSRVVVADITGPDPGVMYGLGVAHTVGKETILIYPQGSKYLTNIPKTLRVEYDFGDKSRIEIETELREILKDMLQSVAAT
jgi:hypothetical protein